MFQNQNLTTQRQKPAIRCCPTTFLSFCIALQLALPSLAQSSRKPTRAKAPEFKQGALDGVFFPDVASLLKGELPKSQASPSGGTAISAKPGDPAGKTEPSKDPLEWKKLISPSALEDLVKGSKLRLDKIVTTPSAFSGGGFVVARREFSLQAVLFAVIENYAGDVRWKKSAAVARERMVRVAANTKVGSIQAYNEAKKRMLDLSDLVNGSQLTGDPKTEVEWSSLIDRIPLMQLLEWAQDENVSKQAASKSSFDANRDQLQQFAELIAVLGKAAIQEDMPDAADDDYVSYTMAMIEHAQQVGLAVQTGDADLARQAASRIGQSCTNCHDDFR